MSRRLHVSKVLGVWHGCNPEAPLSTVTDKLQTNVTP